MRKYQEQIEKKNKNNKNELEHKKLTKKEINEEINRDVEDMDVVNKRLIAGAMKMEENVINNKNEAKEKIDDEENNKDLLLSDELEEPIPRNDHKYCHICKTKFEKYVKHIKCYSHFENLQRHQNFFNRFKKSFERIINFWDIRNGRLSKNINIKNNTNNIETSVNPNAPLNINKLLSPIKSEEISTKEGSLQDKNIISNIINLLNNGNNNNINNNENINNNYNNNTFKANKNDINIKNNINTTNNITNNNIIHNNTTYNNTIHNNTSYNNLNINNNLINNTKKIINNSNIDLNKPPKNINLQNTNNNTTFISTNNKKIEEKNTSKIFTPFIPINNVKNKFSDFHIFNLTYSNTSNNKNIFKNENTNNINNNKIRTINYISINNKKDEENNINKINEKKIQFKKDEKIQIQPKKKFVTKCFPKFSTLQTFPLTKPKKRKKNEFYKGGDIFVISTPKKIEYDYFPILSIDNPKKLINKNIVYFQ